MNRLTFVSALIIAAMGFGVGYWVGQTPRFFQKNYVFSELEVTVFLDEHSFLNEPLLQTLKSNSQIQFKVTDKEPETADIWVVNTDFLKKTSQALPDFLVYEENTIDPDFHFHALEKWSALPIAWSNATDQFVMKLLLVPKRTGNQKNEKKILALSHIFFSAVFQRQMINNTKWNSTISYSNNFEVDEARKASAIRKVSLINLKKGLD